jgi:hypothetical protein
MRNHEIESWALDIVDRVRKQQPIEDDRVELKAEWPEATKAARRLAGHANAARGAPILWVVGVDEAAGAVPGINFSDVAAWYSAVSSQFDELAPQPVTLNVPAEGVTVAALYFETDRAPFVVKNPTGGTIQREVPWREATGIKSATRSQLLRMLVPQYHVPDAEVIAAYLDALFRKSETGEPMARWDLGIAIYIGQPRNQQLTIPGFRTEFKWRVQDLLQAGAGTGAHFVVGPSRPAVIMPAITVNGADIIEVHYTSESLRLDAEWEGKMQNESELEVLMYPSDLTSPLSLQATLVSVSDGRHPYWRKNLAAYSFAKPSIFIMP